MRTLILGSIRLVIVTALVYALLFLVLVKIQVGGSELIHRTSEVLGWKGGNSWQRFQDYDPGVFHDVVAIGSSHAYRGYDPRIFGSRGYDLFNLGSSAQTPRNTWPIVKAYIDSSNTGLLLVDVYGSIFNNNGMESAIDLVQNVDDDQLAAHLAWTTNDPRGVTMFLLRMAKQNQPPVYEPEGYVTAGYCEVVDSVKGDLVYRRSGLFEWDSEQYRYMECIVAHCRERGIPLVLVTHPMPLVADTSAHRIFSTLLRHNLGPEGPYYLDLALDHTLDERNHFFDQSHLNQAGVDLFVPRLIDSLEALGYLRRPVP